MTKSQTNAQGPQTYEQRRMPAGILNNDFISKFLRKNWFLLGVVSVCIVIFINSNSNTSTNKTTNRSSYKTTQNAQQNVYRGTKIAKLEFYKKSKRERLGIQKFLKDNFGYTSTFHGLWVPNTANSFICAANRNARNVSLYSATNVNRVFNTAL